MENFPNPWGESGRSFGGSALLPHGSKEAVPFEILAQGTQAGTAGRGREIFGHSELLCEGPLLPADPCEKGYLLRSSCPAYPLTDDYLPSLRKNLGAVWEKLR